MVEGGAPMRIDSWFKRFFRIFLSILIFFGSTFPIGTSTSLWAAMPYGPHPQLYVPGEVLVKFKPPVDRLTMEKLHEAIGSATKKVIRKTGITKVKLPEHLGVEDAIKHYSKSPDVEYAEPNYIYAASSLFPSDPFFSQLWGLYNVGQTGGVIDADIDAPEAWSVSTGSLSIAIAVIDTGVDTSHPDLLPNLWTNPSESTGMSGIDDDGNGYVDDIHGWDFLEDDGDPSDYNGHGTHVAATIAAKGDNAMGITGVMWSARIMPLRFLGASGAGDTAAAVEAIHYAVDNGAKVINASWGGGGYSRALYDALAYALSKEVLFVAAAGNEENNNDLSPFYPCGYDLPNVICVAATDDRDQLAWFSNYGARKVHLGAPGVSVFSSVPLFSYGPLEILYSQDFDGGETKLAEIGWASGGTYSTWAITPGTGVGGTRCLEDSPGALYRNNTASLAVCFSPFLSEKNKAYTLWYDWKGSLEYGFDVLAILFSDNGISFGVADYRTGTTSGVFVSDYSDLTVVGELMPQFYIGFGLLSDSTFVNEGVCIDNLLLSKQDITPAGHGYEFLSGTSMAAPHVSGTAGLMLSVNPHLSASTIKNILMETSDSKPSLTGKTASGGRLNAFQAVRSALLFLSLDEGTVGTEISLIGSHFGTERGKVWIGSGRAKVVQWADDLIRFVITKPQSPGTYPLRVVRKGEKTTYAVLDSFFTYRAPEIDTVFPSHGSTGMEVTVEGSFFGTKKGEVFLGGVSCNVKSWTMNPWNGSSQVVFVVPNGLGPGTYDVIVKNKVGADIKGEGFRID